MNDYSFDKVARGSYRIYLFKEIVDDLIASARSEEGYMECQSDVDVNEVRAAIEYALTTSHGGNQKVFRSFISEGTNADKDAILFNIKKFKADNIAHKKGFSINQQLTHRGYSGNCDLFMGSTIVEFNFGDKTLGESIIKTVIIRAASEYKHYETVVFNPIKGTVYKFNVKALYREMIERDYTKHRPIQLYKH